ncbi:replicative DNA helicase [Rhizobium azibense]|uniref:DNA 5'-3' helicase n=1 Tax=Rhizobium azibense TaxID=1136135 RepID=A0A4R3RKD5_9HYPH|nr:DnaB-like helicase C-terminal domain-containing protein [Rhizobium azibense]TCU34082.1 replicative DNA helicase [Rhizobium azibense]
MSERNKSRERSQPATLTNADAEKIVIGKILQSEATYWQINGTIQGFHFSVEIFQTIFDAYRLIVMDGKKPTLSLLQSRVGPEYGDGSSTMTLMTALIRNTAEIEDISNEVTKVIEMWQRRRTIEICEQFVKEAKKADTDTCFMLSDLENCVKDVSVNSQAEPLKTMGDIVTRVINSSMKTRETGVSPGFDTGLASLDQILGRIFPGDLGFIGARPGDGKTVLGLQLLDRIQEDYGPVCFFSLEMRDEDLGRRSLAGRSGVSVAGIEEGTYDAFELEELRAAQKFFMNSRMLVDDRPGIRLDQFRDRCVVLKRSRGLKAAAIDHIRLMKALGKFGNRFDRVEYITGTLKEIAKDVGIAIVALSQVTRSSQRRDDPRPQLNDFDGGSSIEQDADWAISLFRRDRWLRQQKPHDMESPDGKEWAEKLARCKGMIEVSIPKRRRGEDGGICELKFDGKASLLREKER